MIARLLAICSITARSFTYAMAENTQDFEQTLVIGGTGKSGRRVAARLAERGHPVRLGSRSGTPPFEWADPSTWAPALADVDSVYLTYYPDISAPEAPGVIGPFSRLAVDSGVRRMVVLSGRGEEEAYVSERAMCEAGAEWTVLRGSWFAQNFSEDFLLEPVLDGRIVLPATEVGEGFVDLADVADVAVAALTEAGHSGEIYELSGPRLLTFDEAAAELSEAVGRDIRYVPVPIAEYVSVLAEQMPREQAELMAGIFDNVLDGRNAHLTDGVRRALGRAPRDFADYARETAATGVWSVAAHSLSR